MKVSLLKLRKILLCDYLYYFIFLISLIVFAISISNPIKSKNYTSFEGIVTNIKVTNYVSLEIKNAKDKIIGTYYLKDDEKLNLDLGDRVKVSGKAKTILKNTNPNLFNYKNYLASKKIFNKIEIENIYRLKKNTNIFYKIKKDLNNNISQRKNAPYLRAFIMGDTSDIKIAVKNKYLSLGVNHLFAISGMHISLITGTILLVLKKLKVEETKRYLITSLFLVFYMFITSFSASVLRSGLFFIFLAVNNVYYFNIKPQNVLLLVISLIIIQNPFIIYNTGFIYSSVISFTLLIESKNLEKNNNYLINLFQVSLISFIASFLITVTNNFEINVLSTIFNLFYVPFVSYLLLPLCFINLFLPITDPILSLLVKFLESLTLMLGNVKSKIILSQINLPLLILYLLIIFLILFKRRIIYYFLLIILIVFHHNINFFFPSSYIMMIDIGQGDSIIVHSNNETVLIDTGGKEFTFKNSNNSNTIAYNTTYPLLKSLGIKKIDRLILTHGDNDHLGEAKNLIDLIEVDKVYFNLGKRNKNELDLIEKLESKKIKYTTSYENLTFKVGNFKFWQLNREYDDENTSSSIYLAEIDGYKILFTGDASCESEKYILTKLDTKIDILKVGHHGSKTSTSEELLDSLAPQIALISSGRDNKFNHPHRQVVDLLRSKKVSIYNTQTSGAIEINFKKNVTISPYFK